MTNAKGYLEWLEQKKATEKNKNNFMKIAESAESLAKWLDDKISFCFEINCDECCVNKECWHQGNDTNLSNRDLWLNWLTKQGAE